MLSDSLSKSKILTAGLVKPIILLKIDSCVEGSADVDKGRQAARRQTFEPLHGGRRSVRYELEEPSMIRSSSKRFVNRGKF